MNRPSRLPRLPSTARDASTGAPAALLTLIALIAIPSFPSGCASRPAPPPPPRAASEADRLSTQAAKLQREDNWAGAADWWQRAGRQYQLLNRPADVALAQHNEGTCRRALGQPEAALRLLGDAATTNLRLGRTNAWWRNQIALLQLENTRDPGLALNHLRQLDPLLPSLQSDPTLLGLIHHESARAQVAAGQPPANALESANRAQALFQRAKDPAGEAAVRLTRARILQGQGDLAAAVVEWRLALATFAQLGQPRAIATSLAGLGTALTQEDPSNPEGLEMLRRARDNFAVLKMEGESLSLQQLLDRLEKGVRSANPPGSAR